MDSDGKTRSYWGIEESVYDDFGGVRGAGADSLRTLKRTHQDPSPESTFPEGSANFRERRCSRRYPCDGSAEIYSTQGGVRVWATLTDLSRGGCYLEIHATSPVHTMLDLALEVLGIRFRAKGRVAVCYPFLGMGIAFTELSSADQGRLDELLVLLANGPASTRPTEASKEFAPAVPVASPTEARTLFDALTIHFQNARMLTREDFARLVARHCAARDFSKV